MKLFRLFLLFSINILLTFAVNAQSIFWQQVTDSLKGHVLSYTVKPDGTIFACAHDNGIYRSDDKGFTWTKLPMDSVMNSLYYYGSAIRTNNELYFATSGYIFATSDDGATWRQIISGLGDPFINMIGIKPNGDIFASTLYHGLYKSTNKGTNWVDANNGLNGTDINTIAFASNGDIFLGTYNGIYFSRDNGNSWKQMNSGLTSGATNIYSIAFQKQYNILVGTTRGSIFRSTNNGGTWSPIFDLKDSSYVYSIIIKNEAEFFAGVRGKGVYMTVDSGATWFPVNDGLLNKDVMCLHLIESDKNDLLAGTWGYGIFRGSDGAISITFNGGQYCAGTEIDIPFTLTVAFDSTNTFAAQLSDSTGKFDSPVNIGSLKSGKAGMIKATIPKNTPSGTGYRVRLTSSKPATKSDNNGFDITIKALPVLSINGSLSVCADKPYTYTTDAGPDVVTRWSAVGGQLTGDITGGQITVTWDSVNKGVVKLYQKSNITGCEDSLQQMVSIIIPAKPIIKRNGLDLVSSYTNGNQWYTEDGKPIFGANSQRYTPASSGWYLVSAVDSASGCATPMSDKFYIDITSVFEPITGSGLIEITPNPASDYIDLNYKANKSIIDKVIINNLTGETVVKMEKPENGRYIHINTSSLPSGTYFIKAYSGDVVFIEKFVVNK